MLRGWLKKEECEPRAPPNALTECTVEALGRHETDIEYGWRHPRLYGKVNRYRRREGGREQQRGKARTEEAGISFVFVIRFYFFPA